MCKHLTCWLQRFLLLTVFQHGSLHIQSWFLQLFFSSFIRLISFTYDHTWYKNTQTHMFSCLLTLLTTHKPHQVNERLSVGRRRGRWRFHPAAGGKPETPFSRHYLACALLFSCKINQTDEKTKITNGSILPQNLEKVKPPHQPITDRAASC